MTADLESKAYFVADEYRSGRLANLDRGDWDKTWRNLIAELRPRCPGFSDAEYSKALNDGFTSSR
jgi:hypothetical protein